VRGNEEGGRGGEGGERWGGVTGQERREWGAEGGRWGGFGVGGRQGPGSRNDPPGRPQRAGGQPREIPGGEWGSGWGYMVCSKCRVLRRIPSILQIVSP
jgi:hypothetical protein